MNTNFGFDRLVSKSCGGKRRGIKQHFIKRPALGTFRHANLKLFPKCEIIQNRPSIKCPRQLFGAITAVPVHAYHQMYWLEERPGAGYPFGDSVASFRLVGVLEIAIETMVVDYSAGNVVGTTMRDSVISIDNVFATR